MLRSHRTLERRQTLQERSAVFKLRLAWFVVPIQSLQRVLPIEDKLPQLTQAGRPVPVLDLASHLFGKFQGNAQPFYVSGAAIAPVPCLLVLRSLTGELLAVPSDSQTALLRLTDNDFTPLPATYARKWDVAFITRMSMPVGDRPSLFAIDPEALFAELPRLQFPKL